MFPTRWDQIMREFSVFCPALLPGKPCWYGLCSADISAWLAVLYIIWYRLWPKWIWKRICWKRWCIKFAFLLQRASGLRTALTDRLLLLLSLSANAAPYGIFCHCYRGCRVKSPKQRLPVPRQRMLAWAWRLKLPFQLKWNRAHYNWHQKGQFHNYIN